MYPDSRTVWSSVEKALFRFLASYVFLFFFPIPSGLSDPEALSGLFDPAWHRLAKWTAHHVFHIEIVSFSNGSGDTTYDYVRVFCMFVISTLVTVVWSLVDRRRASYQTLHAWGRLWLRYAVACAMLTYGISKLFHGQFYDPTYNVLTTPVGDMSPQRLLWTVIGTSRAYEFFCGAGEVLGGTLLLFRRTTLLGALIVVGVMSNVVALNMSYDVCVKLGSMHLLFAAVLLVVPDARRLWAMFVLDRPVAKGALGVSLPRSWMGIAVICTQVLLVAAFVVSEVRPYLARPGPLTLFAVRTFSQDGKELDDADPERWKQFAFSTDRAMISRGGRRTYFEARSDAAGASIAVVNAGDAVAPIAGDLHVARDGDQAATLEGTFNGRQVHATLVAQDRAKLRLLRTGFHWIHEEPDSEPR